MIYLSCYLLIKLFVNILHFDILTIRHFGNSAIRQFDITALQCYEVEKWGIVSNKQLRRYKLDKSHDPS